MYKKRIEQLIDETSAQNNVIELVRSIVETCCEIDCPFCGLWKVKKMNNGAYMHMNPDGSSNHIPCLSAEKRRYFDHLLLNGEGE